MSLKTRYCSRAYENDHVITIASIGLIFLIWSMILNNQEMVALKVIS
uniref:Uncharacterized protein n=1 Tax=Arundo donax TaxID=35708 RepID=A0A0A9A9K7_ARUDO